MRRVLSLAVPLALVVLAACGLSLSGTGPDFVDPSIVLTEAGPEDAGTDAGDTGPASIAPSDPGVFACNGTTCTAGQQRCCSDKFGTNCRAFTQNCGGSEVDCDETADCPTGRACCLGPDPGAAAYPSAMCFTACRASDAHVCKSDSECDGGTCVAIRCGTRSYGTCGGVKPTVCP